MYYTDLYRFRTQITFEYDSFFRKCNRLHLSTIPRYSNVTDYMYSKESEVRLLNYFVAKSGDNRVIQLQIP